MTPMKYTVTCSIPLRKVFPANRQYAKAEEKWGLLRLGRHNANHMCYLQSELQEITNAA